MMDASKFLVNEYEFVKKVSPKIYTYEIDYNIAKNEVEKVNILTAIFIFINKADEYRNLRGELLSENKDENSLLYHILPNGPKIRLAFKEIDSFN